MAACVLDPGSESCVNFCGGLSKRMQIRHLTHLVPVAALSCPAFGMSAILTPSIPSPAPFGQIVTWTATVPDANPGTLWYRFTEHEIGKDTDIIVDYGPESTLDWTASNHEGVYSIQVYVRNVDTGDTATAATLFQFQSLVSAAKPVITPTAHPLVLLYSAPACDAGGRMRVEFTGPDKTVQTTPYQACQAGLSMNFYLAGLQSQTQYSAHHILDTGSAFENGPVLTTTTGKADSGLVGQTVMQAPPSSSPDKILLQAPLLSTQLATDLNGNVVWYYPGDVSYLTRPAAGGHFFGVVEDTSGDQSQQVVREIDLTGMTVKETNAARVGEQLVAMGLSAIGGFHHEARLLQDGKILVLASVEQILTDVQGPGPIDVLGDMIVVMDSNLQVAWAWNAFDHLDVTRLATLNDQCLPGDCPPLYLAATANDWLHGNSVQQMPDGNLLYSSRSQDWVIKIDYENGNGTGGVLWRLGQDGDFQINSSDPSPWFSHQHDPQAESDNITITLFDDGNGRNVLDPTANSRGQVIQLDEQNLIANLILNADLGQYSFALGAAQKLPNGNYHFDNGYLSDATAMSVEVDPSGNMVYALHSAAPEYRSFRMADIYTP